MPEDSVRREAQTLVVLIRRKGFVGSLEHQFFYLYFLNRFYKKSMSIPKILPLFMQDWFEEFVALSKTDAIFNDTRDYIYRVIVAYLLVF